MMIKLLISAIALSAGLASAGVYKWVDKEGNIHYGDTAPPGGVASKLDLPENSRYTPRELPRSISGKDSQTQDSASAAEQPTRYTLVRIESPPDNGTVRSNEGNVMVKVELQPPLGDGHGLGFTLDGTTRPGTVPGSAFQISNVQRGTHALSVMVLDENGNELGRSATTRFTLRKASLAERARTSPTDTTGGNNDDAAEKNNAGNSSAVPNNQGTAPGNSSNSGSSNFAPNYNNTFAPKYTP